MSNNNIKQSTLPGTPLLEDNNISFNSEISQLVQATSECCFNCYSWENDTLYFKHFTTVSCLDSNSPFKWSWNSPLLKCDKFN